MDWLTPQHAIGFFAGSCTLFIALIVSKACQKKRRTHEPEDETDHWDDDDGLNYWDTPP